MTRIAVELSSGSWPGSKSSVYLARQSAIPQTSQCQHWSLALCSARRPPACFLADAESIIRVDATRRRGADATASAAAATTDRPTDRPVHRRDASNVDMQYAYLLCDGVWS